jgi:aryl-alcohol dehydrogenase-like predicted oxidoreductase
VKREAGAHSTTPAAIALAWLAAQPTVAAPVASARTTGQLSELAGFGEIVLDEGELDALSESTERVQAGGHRSET